VRIQSFDRRFRAFGLGAANIRCTVQNLALKVRQRDFVVVENADLAEARRREGFVTLPGFTCFYCLPEESPATRFQCLSLATIGNGLYLLNVTMPFEA
jgi:hypothetical protein